MSEITADILANYMKKNQRTWSRTLAVLGDTQPFMDAVNSETGRELLKEAISTHEALLSKIARMTATEEEKMEFRVISGILVKWSEKIDRHKKARETVANEGLV